MLQQYLQATTLHLNTLLKQHAHVTTLSIITTMLKQQLTSQLSQAS